MTESILAETLDQLKSLHGEALSRLRIERAVVGVVFSGVKLSDGRGAMAGTPRSETHHPHKDREKPPPGALKGLSVLSLLEPLPEDPFLLSLAVAALGALSAPWLESDKYRAVYDKDALDLIAIRPGMAVTIVGAFHSYIERLRKVEGLRLKVLELRESAMHEEDLPFYVPAERAQEIVPGSDALIVTGLTIANRTLEDLLRLARPGAEVAVVGPSGSIVPDALFRRNVRMASGCVLSDPDLALDLLSQGACARHLYGRCGRKLNLTLP
ncbi:MAG: DUF364 domain-containing protein [Elusimicrobia bacterium]|nr:DUF364 domain-containing protein [Elusimicrobiota bacterium]